MGRTIIPLGLELEFDIPTFEDFQPCVGPELSVVKSAKFRMKP